MKNEKCTIANGKWFCSVGVLLLCSSLSAQTTSQSAPGWPGQDAHWPTAAKNGFGTANTIASKVWFTLADGVMTEVYYPRIDNPNTQCLQLIVCSDGGCQSEADDMTHEIRVVGARSLSFRQVNRTKDRRVTITKTYVTDPDRSAILIQTSITGLAGGERVYLYYDPSLNNSGLHDSAWISGNVLVAADADVATALVSSGGFSEMTNGYLGTSDGWLQLKTTSRIDQFGRADNGNVVQVAQVRTRNSFTLSIGFGRSEKEAVATARTSLNKGFHQIQREYDAGWSSYLKSLRPVAQRNRRQFHIAAMVLKGLEDKTYRGAIIASPSIPWGGGPNANEPTVSGYHAVWPRDLYQIATALYVAGDEATANRALDYLFNVQQQSDGSFPQNTWVNGKVIGGGRQLDQVALPIVLAHQLRRFDHNSWIKRIKLAAEFLMQNGPATPQERWEEESGYSPSTLASEIAGLVCAADIARIHGDRRAADRYLTKADEWGAAVAKWTATSTGTHGDGKYFLRITEKGNPDEDAKLEINSGGGTFDQREIVDAGLFELVRLGIKRADDPLILKSLAVIDKLIKVKTPVGPGWYRYNGDAYGERKDGNAYDGRTGKGRLWTLLTGERAEYELARGNVLEAAKLLNTLSSFANEGLMLPEQVWDRTGSTMRAGTGTGSATPLAWSMAQFMRLVINVQNKRNLETPAIVALRYRSRN